VPEAVTENFAVPPAVTVVLDGCDVMDGAVALEPLPELPLPEPAAIAILQTDSAPLCAQAAQLPTLELRLWNEPNV
jgi:hypothetical protein